MPGIIGSVPPNKVNEFMASRNLITNVGGASHPLSRVKTVTQKSSLHLRFEMQGKIQNML